MSVRTYKSAPIQVQALKWDGSDLEGASTIVSNWDTLTVNAQGILRFRFTDSLDDLVISIGDYLVKHSDSIPTGWVPAAVFEASFQEVEA